MLIATQSTSVAGTQKYFETVLTQGDYYLGHEVAGTWRGEGARILGLEEGATVTNEEFSALLAGVHPRTGRRLVQRVRKDRRPGVDLTFSVPKSVSLAWAILEDERLIEALREAVHETMRLDVEPLMRRRVRTGDRARTKDSIPTGKLIYADFLHKTSRPVAGTADPHLHVHAFVLNWTEENGRYYAAEFAEIIRQRATLQAKFDARLARKLQALGYGVERVRFRQSGRMKRGWEIRGIARSVIEKFSRRTAQIEQYAQEHGVDDAAAKGRLGKLTREQKDEGQTVELLRAKWQSRLTPAERETFDRLGGKQSRDERANEAERADASVAFALEHHLYRQSTVERREIVATALEHALTLSPESIEAALDRTPIIEREVEFEGARRTIVTTQAILDAERRLIDYVRDGRGTKRALGEGEHEFVRDWLNDDQKHAVQFVLDSRDAVLAIVGGAGTGKTSLMTEAVEGIENHGKRVFTFAPSTGAREVLQQEGFENSETVEHLIRNESFHPKLQDQVIWIDEAGLLDVRSLNAVFDIAQEHNARVVLSGDTRQHASPRRGEAMRLLEREAGLPIARAEAIQRQRGKYKQAVELISRGYEVVDERTGKTGLLAGYDLLNSLGKVKELPRDERHQALAKTYVKGAAQGKSTLVIAPTHAEARAATEAIRGELRAAGNLSAEERTLQRFESLNLTEAEKGEARTYATDKPCVVQFHQNVAGFRRGERLRVSGVAGKQVTVIPLAGGAAKQLPLDAPDRFEVYAEQELKLAVGDKVRFSLGGTTKEGDHRISNGRLDEVKGFNGRGDVILKNGWVVAQDYAHLDLGYVVTSHASQGKDADITLAAMGSESLPAINARQFYVTVSRGRQDVLLFVDDKREVRKAIERSGEQLSATEAIRGEEGRTKTHEADHAARRAGRSFRERVSQWWRELSGAARDGAPREPGLNISPQLGLGGGVTPSPGRSRSL